MGVAVQLLPVTGQTLPLVSSGGSSIWMTCIALGIIISVTKKEAEIAQELEDKEQRNLALQKLIDKQIEEDEKETEQLQPLLTNNQDYSITETAKNPMDAVKYKL